MRVILIIIIMQLSVACSFRANDSVLKSMGGNVYYNGGLFGGESIKLFDNYTFTVSRSTCTESWHYYNGSWELKKDTLILSCRNLVDPNEKDIDEIIRLNYFKQLKFIVYNNEIDLIYVDRVNVDSKGISYDLSE